MEFRILGPLEVVEGGQELKLRGTKQRALLAALLLSGNRVVPTETLVDQLWGDEPPETAVKIVQNAVSQLRRLFEDSGQRLATVSPGYLLRLEPGELDAERFARLTAEGREALEGGRAEVAAEKLREALALWRGPALAGLELEPFAGTAAARLEERRLGALEDRIDADLGLGRHAELVGELEALVAEHPLNERLRAQLILALYRSGRQAEALEAYQRTRRHLVEELGIEPGPALQRLEKAVLRQDPDLELAPAPRRAATAVAAPEAPPRELRKTVSAARSSGTAAASSGSRAASS